MLDLEEEQVKNDDPRKIPLNQELKQMLVSYVERNKRLKIITPWVFLNPERKNRIFRFDKAWATACEKAGVGKRLFHDFRRTAVRDMIRAGVPQNVAMKISGHKTASVFARYNIVDDQDIKDALEKTSAYRQKKQREVQAESAVSNEQG